MTTHHPGHWDISELQGSPRRRTRERIVGRLAFAAAAVSVLISAGIVYALLFEAIKFMVDVDWSRTWGQIGWIPRQGYFDLPTILVASLWVTVIAMAVAAPLGLAAAIYLSEYADARVRRTLKPALEILAGLGRGEFETHFPRRFSWAMKLLKWLPHRLYFALMAKATGSAAAREAPPPFPPGQPIIVPGPDRSGGNRPAGSP